MPDDATMSSAPTSDCVLVTQPGAFVVTATSPYAPGYECVYESAAPDGQRPLAIQITLQLEDWGTIERLVELTP